MTCSVRDKLSQEAQDTLNVMIEEIQKARDALKRDDKQLLKMCDRSMEVALGKKERAFGALAEHKREHGC
jgi:hypothetical protein